MWDRDYENRCYEDDPRWQDIQFQHQVDAMTTDSCSCHTYIHADALDRVRAAATAGVSRQEFCENGKDDWT